MIASNQEDLGLDRKSATLEANGASAMSVQAILRSALESKRGPVSPAVQEILNLVQQGFLDRHQTDRAFDNAAERLLEALFDEGHL